MGKQAALKSPGALAATTASTIAAIGTRIRALRRARSMTLQALADATGLSASLISVVERGRSAPSIASLIAIAEALGVPISALLAAPPEAKAHPVVRPDAHAVIEDAPHAVRRLIRADPARAITVALSEYAPLAGGAEVATGPEGHAYGYVLAGMLTVELDGVAHALEAGDLIAFDAQRRHRIWNHGSAPVRALWFNLAAV